ncbi:MAG: nucleotidyltransferase domain-containing protein [Candidatus Cloacimonetes bacterium]|nr:nucleotidyltransferase domain-containing protein [Candidatus Cloacimonadota bacterium]
MKKKNNEVKITNGVKLNMDTLMKMDTNGISLKHEDIERICMKYKIRELSVFGSAIRDDFNNKSDIDFLVSFKENSELTLFDLVNLQQEFTCLLDRNVDIVEKEGLTNPIRKKVILSTAEVLYVY